MIIHDSLNKRRVISAQVGCFLLRREFPLGCMDSSTNPQVRDCWAWAIPVERRFSGIVLRVCVGESLKQFFGLLHFDPEAGMKHGSTFETPYASRIPTLCARSFSLGELCLCRWHSATTAGFLY